MAFGARKLIIGLRRTSDMAREEASWSLTVLLNWYIFVIFPKRSPVPRVFTFRRSSKATYVCMYVWCGANASETVSAVEPTTNTCKQERCKERVYLVGDDHRFRCAISILKQTHFHTRKYTWIIFILFIKKFKEKHTGLHIIYLNI